MGKFLRPDQIHRLQNPGTRAEWSKKTLQECIALKTLCGGTAYMFMYSKNFPIPHINTIRNHLAKIECQPGILQDFLDLTEMKIATMKARDKYCALVIDEMAIKAKYVFNNHTQSFWGNPTLPVTQSLIANRLAKDPTWDQNEALATHALNAMIAGLCARFKVLVGVHATDNAYCPKEAAKWIKEIIQKCYDIDLIVKVIVMDMGPNNQAI